VQRLHSVPARRAEHFIITPGAARFKDRGYDERAMRLVLASASARRRDLLAAAGVRFTVDPADADERRRTGEPPEAYVARVARDKVHAGRRRHPDAAVLGADTSVVVDGHVLGKPADAGEAAAMLRRLSGRSHDVLTAVVLAWPGHERAAVARTRVWFAALSDGEIGRYVRTGEPLDKAGAYAIQGLASRFVTRIDGSYSNVVGLPLAEVLQMLGDAGIG
jgi:septum formation protein